jgi:hypothetical protein
LIHGLEGFVATPRYWEGAIYYRSPSVLALLAATAVANGAGSAEPFLQRFLADHEEMAAVEGADVTPLERAAYVAAASEHCRLRGLNCDRVRKDLELLVHLQRPDGSWPAAALYQASQGYYGSPAETTATAVRALNSWLLAQREDLGAPGALGTSRRERVSQRLLLSGTSAARKWGRTSDCSAGTPRRTGDT